MSEVLTHDVEHVSPGDPAPDVAPTGSSAQAVAGGVVAAAVSLGVAELATGAFDNVPSLIVAVADALVDHLPRVVAGALDPLFDVEPADVVRASIDRFGSNQKTVLVTGIVIVSLLAGGLLGRLATRSRGRAVAGFGFFALIGIGAVALEEQDFSVPLAAVAAVLAGIAGAITLLTLLPRPASTITASAPTVANGADRRSFMGLAGTGLAVAGVSAFIGRWLTNGSRVAQARSELVIPPASSTTLATPSTVAEAGGATTTSAVAIPATIDEVAGISPYITPNNEFYRIDTAVRVPQVNPADWEMRFTGMVDNELSLTLDDLLGMDLVEEIATISCVSNEVGGDLVGNAVWTGVLLDDLLEQAGVQPGADQIVGRSVDGWTGGFPTEIARDGRPAMVAIGMNGEPLPIIHGFPARLIIPGLYGYVSATKWLSEVHLTRWDDFNGYWIPRGWSKEGPVKTQSRIDVPRRNATIEAGTAPIAGVAWAPIRGIDSVEVQIDDGPWLPARLGDAVSGRTWVQWVVEWDATPGDHVVSVRATDGDGETQTDVRRPVAPDGATGHHTVRFSVEQTA